MHKSSSFCIIIAIDIVAATTTTINTTMVVICMLIIIMILVIMITTCSIIMMIILISIKISRTYTPLNIWWTMFWCKSPTNSISLATVRYLWSILQGRQYFAPDYNITAWNTWQCQSHWHILMGQKSILYIQTKGTKTSRHPSVAVCMNKQYPNGRFIARRRVNEAIERCIYHKWASVAIHQSILMSIL